MKTLIYSPLFLIGGYGALYVYKTWGTVGIAIMCACAMVPTTICRIITGEWFDPTDPD